MPFFTSEDNAKSGVPLGGIGAGKFEILPNGLLNAFSLLNNWSQPLEGNDLYPGVLGFHFGVYVQPCKSFLNQMPQRQAFLLQTVPVSNIPRVKKIEYHGDFPRATLRYLESSLNLELTLELCSAFIAGDAFHSSLPVCYATFKVRNLNKGPADVGLLFIGRNICGQWCVGRHNQVTETDREVHLEFASDEPTRLDPMAGQLRFSFEKKGWELSAIESWNSVSQNFHYNSQNVYLQAWDFFAKDGRLPSIRNKNNRVYGENHELCGAVCAHTRIEAGMQKEWPWMASWYFPNHAFGHFYSKRFRDSRQVQVYSSRHRRSVMKKTRLFQSLVNSFPFPEWFNEALLSHLAPFYSSTIYVKDGRMAFYEAPIICPLMGTIDVGFYGSIPLSYFFPDLEKSQMRQFAKAQRADGYIPHDLGRSRLDLPSNGTTFFMWKDLNPKFILMVYRDYLWSGDGLFLKQMIPVIKRALEWVIGTDKDGNGLPDNEGADQTFDLWSFKGTCAYTSGIYLAALLACKKIALITGDRPFAVKCGSLFKKGRESFAKELWNGEYFGDVCSLSQLNGQWYADLLRLGDITDRQKTQKALKSIIKRNSSHSKFGMVNSVLYDGCLDNSNEHSRNVWGGMNYAFVSLCVMRGFPLRKMLNQVHKIWDNMTRLQQNTWNLPDMIDSQTGRYMFGDSYYRNMAIWSIPIAYAMVNRQTAKTLRVMRSIT